MQSIFNCISKLDWTCRIFCVDLKLMLKMREISFEACVSFWYVIWGIEIMRWIIVCFGYDDEGCLVCKLKKIKKCSWSVFLAFIWKKNIDVILVFYSNGWSQVQCSFLKKIINWVVLLFAKMKVLSIFEEVKDFWISLSDIDGLVIWSFIWILSLCSFGDFRKGHVSCIFERFLDKERKSIIFVWSICQEK